ncbi:ABC transporter permease [Neptunitalea lumnitzerae]|uniref:ABC transporter permease n=1 Tax=Neptunitalea lumnitzerae TaxID=2965509 RepID=A0ABQ5MGK2_9FLAO|nr:ABC transporter permease [Neptunitalea sp. Y10]GLB48524.1 ABC transporter permease [Neptunitalea sp. Y10]
MVKNWLHIFIYNIKHNKLFTFLNVLGLSVGVAGLIFSILYWNDEHSYNKWNPERNHVFQIINDLRPIEPSLGYWNTNTATLAEYLEENLPSLTDYCYSDDMYTDDILKYGSKKEMANITDAQSNFFSFFPFTFSKGTPESALANRNCIAISENLAKRLFGDKDPMNKQLIYGEHQLTVTGVYHIPGKSSYAPDAVTNLIEEFLNKGENAWGNFNFNLLVKLTDASEAANLKKAIEAAYLEHRIKPDAKEQGITVEQYLEEQGVIKVLVEPLVTARLESVTDGYPEGRGNIQMLLIMMGLSILILVLAIINYVNLATANALKRAKEVGVRKVVGATKGEIVLQFIFESALMIFLSILLALVIAEVVLPLYNQFLNKELVIVGSQFYLQLLALFIILVAVAGVFPALYVANFKTIKVLKGNYTRNDNGIIVRNSMLVLQFAIAAFFIVGSYIVYSQIKYVSTMDLGYNSDQVVQVYYRNPYNWREEGYREQLLSKYLAVKQQIKGIEGVKEVGAGSFSFDHGSNSSSSYEYKNESIQASNMGIDFGMLEMMGVKLKEGRFLSAEFALDTVSNILINETAARLMKEDHPLGKEFPWRNNKNLKVVGVVKDFHVNGPQEEIPPMLFFHFKTVEWMIQNTHHIYVKVETSKTAEVINKLEKLWTTKVDVDFPFDYDFVDKRFARTYEQYTNQKNLFLLLNITVVIIALFGLYALASYSIERRMKEIAIRKTLGAETKGLLLVLTKQYIVFGVIGFLLALFPAYYFLTLWLENFVYRIDISYQPFLVGFICLMSLTLAVVLLKAYKATSNVDILKYLKYE